VPPAHPNIWWTLFPEFTDVAVLSQMQCTDKRQEPLALRCVPVRQMQSQISRHSRQAEQALAGIGRDREPGCRKPDRYLVPALLLDRVWERQRLLALGLCDVREGLTDR